MQDKTPSEVWNMATAFSFVIYTNDRPYLFWAHGSSQDNARLESHVSSMHTSVGWFRFCREICETHLLAVDDGMIGGD
jgi:hypothetical protein